MRVMDCQLRRRLGRDSDGLFCALIFGVQLLFLLVRLRVFLSHDK